MSGECSEQPELDRRKGARILFTEEPDQQSIPIHADTMKNVGQSSESPIPYRALSVEHRTDSKFKFVLKLSK